MAEATAPETSPIVDEAGLLARLRRRDDAAFEELVRAYGGRLLAVARRMLVRDDDAREVVQDAFLSAFRNLDRFHGDARLSTWLHRIVVNAALMRLRTRRRKPEESIEPWLPTFSDDGRHREAFASWTEPADAMIEREETQAIVRREIQALPENYRTVLLLRDIEGMETDDVAAAMHLTKSAVKVRLHRARQALRARLAPHFGGRS